MDERDGAFRGPSSASLTRRASASSGDMMAASVTRLDTVDSRVSTRSTRARKGIRYREPETDEDLASRSSSAESDGSGGGNEDSGDGKDEVSESDGATDTSSARSEERTPLLYDSQGFKIGVVVSPPLQSVDLGSAAASTTTTSSILTAEPMSSGR